MIHTTPRVSVSPSFRTTAALPAGCRRTVLQKRRFITASYKYIGLCLFLLAIFRLWHQLPKRPANIALFFLSVAGMLFATVATLLVARDINQVLYQPRIDFFGLPFIYAFSSAVLLASDDRLIRNITAFALSALIAGNINTTAAAAKIWSQGFKAEMSFAERILTRLEDTSGFSPYRKYAFVQGGTLDFRSRFLIPGDSITAADGYTVTAPTYHGICRPKPTFFIIRIIL